jgi:hypothetical protein
MKKLVAALALLCLAAVGFAQESEAPFTVSPGLVGVKFYGIVLDCGLSFAFMPDGMSLYALAGGGYLTQNLRRDYVTGDPAFVTADYQSVDIEWEFGLIQGILGIGPDANLLEAFLLYRGRYRADSMAVSSRFEDYGGVVATQAIVGLAYNGMETRLHNDKSGFFAEASFEYGPGFINEFDYWRVNAKGQFALPLFDIDPEGAVNTLNAYLIGMGSVDYAGGSSVPIFVMQSMGGRDLRGTVGDNVRGYPWKSYDTALKSYVSLEGRLVGPALFGFPIYITALAFVDSGYYYGFADSSSAADSSGFLASVGGGAMLDVFAFAQIGVQAGFRLIDDPSYGQDGTDPFFWGLKIMFHY